MDGLTFWYGIRNVLELMEVFREETSALWWMFLASSFPMGILISLWFWKKGVDINRGNFFPNKKNVAFFVLFSFG